MKFRRGLTLGVAALALALAGCSTGSDDKSSDDNTKPSSSNAKAGDIRIDVITHANAGDSFWDVVKAGAEQAGKDEGVDLHYQSDGDVGKQATLIDNAVAAAFGSAGERCMAISAAVVLGGAASELVDRVSEKALAVKVGSGRDAGSEMGPVVTAQARDRILGLIDAGEQQGARISVDGRGLSVPGHEGGFFVGPTVIDQVTPEMDVYREEIFGPVLSMVRMDDVDAAIDLINANPYGNGTAIFTSSGEAARRFQRGVRVGMIGVNVPIPVPMAYYSFGGWKDSLFGEHHIHGPEGVSFYTRAKVITARWPHVEHAVHQTAQFSFPTAQ
jgi:malonate-semialdehyde dehydrogenase (acetylating)/methylmalonate-semialdehyde dehydrogenase